MKRKPTNRDKNRGAVLYPVVDPIEWARIHNVHIREQNCYDCGVLRVVNTPFASKELRGFLAQPCECGNGPLATTVPANARVRMEFAKIIDRLLRDGL